MNRLLCMVAAGLLSVMIGLFFTEPLHAADARNFNPGRIIDDAVFTNSNSMTVQEIQNFLNSKMPQCDTWGTKPSEFGGGTRAQYAASRGVSVPFTCLKDYYQNTSNGEDNYGKAVPPGAISAAQIIYNYSRQFNINPQTILATLQKENGMVTDEWPFPKQYREAMGFGCPDNIAPGAPACDPVYGSFSAQIYEAARHFRGYMDSPSGWYVPFTTGNNTILWNPNTSCGSSVVNIQNRATVALYSYTPYRPNQAALDAQYGTGDGCSAYGNRNFYMYFTDWFGAVYGDAQIITPVTLLSSTGHGLFTDFVEASFVIRNNSAQSIDVGTIAIAARDSSGRNYDFGAQNIRLAPYQEFLYRSARAFDKEDQYTFWVTSYRENIGWVDNYPSSTSNYQRRFENMVVQNQPTITSDPVAVSELRQGKTTDVSFTAVNNSKYPVNLGRIGAVVRTPSGKNADLAFDNVTSLAPFATYAYSKQFTPQETGDYISFISSTPNNGLTWHDASYPRPINGNDGRSVLQVKNNPTLTQGPMLDIPSPRVGQNISASFRVRNYSEKDVNAGYIGIAVRDPDNRNVDIGGVDLTKLGANSEYVFTGSRAFTKPGTYTAWIVTYKDGAWYDNTPTSEAGSIQRKITFTIAANPTLTQGPMLDIPSPRVGQNISASFKVRNFSEKVANAGYIGIAVRDPDGQNADIGGVDLSTLAANTEHVFTGSRAFTKPGTYTAWIVTYKDGAWYDNAPALESGAVSRKLTFTVLPSPTLTQGISFSGSATAGSPVRGSFVIRNHGSKAVSIDGVALIIRKDGKNYDMPLRQVSIEPNQDFVYDVEKIFNEKGTYTVGISSFNNGVWNDTNYPVSENNSIVRRTTLTIQ